MSSEVEPVEVEAPKARAPEPPEPVVAPESPVRHSGALFDTGMGAGMGAPGAPTLLRQLSRRPPEERKAGIDDLNGRVGNRRVARMIAHEGPVLARWEDTGMGTVAPTQSNADLLATALRTKEISDIKAVRDFSSATEPERIEFLTKLLDQGWVGPADEAAMERIWNSFGDGIVDVVANTSDLWDLCVGRGMDPSAVGALNRIRTAFENDVKDKARGYMQQNLEFANQEMGRLGVGGESSGSPTAELEQTLALQEVQELARGAEQLLGAKERMQGLQVGFNHDQSVRDSLNMTPAFFNPERRPDSHTSGPLQGGGAAPYDWAVVKEQWDAANAALAGIGARNPAVFAAIAQGRNEVRDLGSEDPQQARAAATRVLNTLKRNIEATIPKIDTGDLDWRDLQPIHQQLYAGHPGNSGINWSDQLPKSVAQDVIGDHETSEFWIGLGLGTAAAALFIVASIATGGLATAALLGGLAVSGGQAIRSWENYEDLATAAAGTASEETRLVSEGQVTAAMVQAILDTIFAALDFGQARGIYRGIQAGARMVEALAANSAEAMLEAGLRTGGGDATRAIERAVAELGAEATARRSGKSVDELIAMLPSGSPARDRLLAARELIERNAGRAAETAAEIEARTAVAIGNDADELWKAGRPMGVLLEELPAAIIGGRVSPAFADQLVIEGIESMGAANVLKKMGGWQAAQQALTDQSAAARRFMSWRDAVFNDLENYVVNNLRGQVQRTGTVRNFSNDIDMSFIGANAAEMRDAASQYLARRLGVANSPDAFNHMMLAGLFTDPRRMHAYDGLDAAVRETIARRQAAKQEQLIWNRRLWEATNHGPPGDRTAAVEAIRNEMRSMGISEFAYRPLSQGDISRLARHVDSLHAQLDQAISAGDNAARERLATEIGDAQALINASESGGYFSGGGVRRYVSERPPDRPGDPPPRQFDRLPGGEGQAISNAERLTAVIDQLPKLDHGMLQLAGNTEQVVAGFRAIGKYAKRVWETLGDAGFRQGEWDDLLARCAELKTAADAGASRISAAQAAEFAQRARAAFGEVTAKSQEVLAKVREAANLPDIGDAMGHIQHATIAHTRWLRSSEWTMRHINKIVRAIEQGRRLSELDEGQAPEGEPPARSPHASYPDQNESVAPPAQ